MTNTTDSPIDQLHVLLAEDNDVNRKLTLNILKHFGYKVSLANNGREAVEAFEKHKFDVILMDILMPEMTGEDAIRLIRQKEKSTGGRVPIIAVTTYSRKESRQRYFEAGIDDYLCKPFKPYELSLVLKKVLNC